MIAGTPIFIVYLTLGVFVLWWFFVYMLLSARGLKREEMGRLGEMVDGVDVVMDGISVIACGKAGKDQVQDSLCQGVEACPPYQVSCPFF